CLATIDHAKTLDHMQFVRVWRPEVVDVGFVIHADRVNHQRVALVMSDRFAEPTRGNMFRMWHIQIDVTGIKVFLIDHKDHCWGLDEVKRLHWMEQKRRYA